MSKKVIITVFRLGSMTCLLYDPMNSAREKNHCKIIEWMVSDKIDSWFIKRATRCHFRSVDRIQGFESNRNANNLT